MCSVQEAFQLTVSVNIINDYAIYLLGFLHLGRAAYHTVRRNQTRRLRIESNPLFHDLLPELKLRKK